MEKLIIAALAAGTTVWLYHKLRSAKTKHRCTGCTGNCSCSGTKTLCLSLLCLGLGIPTAMGQETTLMPENVSINGAIEIEASYVDTEENSQSDIALATFELALGAQINDWLIMEAVFLFEEDDTDPPELDSAVIIMGNEDISPFYAQIGKMYLPFGNFDSLFISDPVALEIGETQGTALMVGTTFNGFDINISASNSDVPEDEEDDHINNFTAALSFCPELEDIDLSLGASWIRNIAASNGFIDAVTDSSDAMLEDPVGGWNVWLSAVYAGFIFNIEYVAAADDFEAGQLSFDGEGNDWGEKAKPSALNVELGYEATDSIVVGVKYENAKDCFDWMPETRYGAVVAYNVWNEGEGSLDIALEYMHAQYDTDGEPEEDSVVLQTALAF